MSRNRTRRIARWVGFVVCSFLVALWGVSLYAAPLAGNPLPIWIPLLAMAILTAWLWWRNRNRKHPPGHCQRCGYDLTGNVTGVCSECEEPISTEKT